MDCSPPGSSVHGISQARILEWVAISFSRGSSQPRGQTGISCISRQTLYHCANQGFPDSSVGEESACNAGDPGLIPGSWRSPGEGMGYPLQYSWASLVAQLVKNLPAMWETWVWSLDWEDPLQKGMATQSIFWPEEFHGLLHTEIKKWKIWKTLRDGGYRMRSSNISNK